jgi:hypothetical protein
MLGGWARSTGAKRLYCNRFGVAGPRVVPPLHSAEASRVGVPRRYLLRDGPSGQRCGGWGVELEEEPRSRVPGGLELKLRAHGLHELATDGKPQAGT